MNAPAAGRCRVPSSLAPLVIAILACCAATPSLACSICRCGDPTFNSLGAATHTSSGLYLAFDADRVAKTQGIDEDYESIVEYRETASLLYGVSDRLLLSARLPYSSKDLTAADPTESGSSKGLADPEFAAQYRVWASKMTGDVGQRASVGLVAGVKTPWGRNDLRNADGELLDEHLQPGTGSTDLFLGASGFYLVDRSSSLFASMQWRKTGTNDRGYRYGNSFLVNLAYERKFQPWLDTVLELNYRDAGIDQVDSDGTLDGNTGGSMLYLAPRLLFDLGHGIVLRMGVQIPVHSSLNGEQTEKANYNVGLTYTLGQP
jgi:hypothetical protein